VTRILKDVVAFGDHGIALLVIAENANVPDGDCEAL
jgi:hypothetical protein